MAINFKGINRQRDIRMNFIKNLIRRKIYWIVVTKRRQVKKSYFFVDISKLNLKMLSLCFIGTQISLFLLFPI